MPDGVYNVIQGEGETGALLTAHPGCDKLSFTGSVATGEKIMQVRIRGVTIPFFTESGSGSGIDKRM